MESGQEHQRQGGGIKSVSFHLQAFWGSWFYISVVWGAERTIPTLLASWMQLFAWKKMEAITDPAKHTTVEPKKDKQAQLHESREVQMTSFVRNGKDCI